MVSGESASKLHDIGDLRATKSEFTTPTRKQTQRSDIRYRTRVLPEVDVTVRDGLPVTTRERTIADLVEDRQDLSTVGNALRDAAKQSHLDVERLIQLLAPLAERNGHHKGDGEALLDTLARIAGINLDSLATQMAAIPDLGALVTARYLDTLAKQVASGLPSDVYRRQLRIISDALSAVAMPGLGATSAAIISSGLTDAYARLADQLNAVDWAALAWAQSTKRKEVAQ